MSIIRGRYEIFIRPNWVINKNKGYDLSFCYHIPLNVLEGENIEYEITYEQSKKIYKIPLFERTYNNTML